MYLPTILSELCGPYVHIGDCGRDGHTCCPLTRNGNLCFTTATYNIDATRNRLQQSVRLVVRRGRHNVLPFFCKR